MKMILQKVIAASGYTSRRQAEQLIRQGSVKLNGRTALVGEQADAEIDQIMIKGRLISNQVKKIYLKLNKPIDYVCTNRRFAGEKNIFSLIPIKELLFTVGRLDKNSRGLLLLTNDGTLNQKLSHPRFQQEKIYQVRLKKSHRPNQSSDNSLSAGGEKKRLYTLITQLTQGVDIGQGDGVAKVKKAECLQSDFFIITLNEGKKRQIRRMFKVLGEEVIDLKRVSLAGLALGSLAEGHWAYLTDEEMGRLNKLK